MQNLTAPCEPTFDFDDVLVLPRISDYTSRSEVDLEIELVKTEKGRTVRISAVPIMISNMATTGTFEMAKVAQRHGFLTAINKFYTVDAWSKVKSFLNPNYAIYSVGANPKYREAELENYFDVNALYDDELPFLMVDVANGYSRDFHKWIEHVRTLLDRYTANPKWLIAGNVIDPSGVHEIVKSGADIVKIGIGSGNMCKTRVQTGIGLPQFSAVQWTRSYEGIYTTISDGGVHYPGDIVKAFVAGADYVMAGTVFSGFDESGGEVVEIDGQQCMTHYGMSSKTAQRYHYGAVQEYRASEGRTVLIPYRGAVESYFNELKGSLRSAITYTNSSDLLDLRNASWMQVHRTHENRYESLDTDA